MQMRFWIKGFAIVPVLCLAGLSAAAHQQGSSQQQTGDPVADAARKAREAKKDTPKPKKVYTDDDVKKSAPADASGATTATAVQATGEAAKSTEAVKTGGATTTEDPNGEAAWRKRFQAQRDKIAKAEKELDVLGRELEKAQVEYYPDPQKAMKQQNSRADINAINAKIDAKRKEVDQLRQGLDDLEDQLRKSGGDPGWGR
jgi:predicted RNase H-like nuclease (RuvC/YqgF family)